MRRIIAIFCVAILSISFAGCAQENSAPIGGALPSGASLTGGNATQTDRVEQSGNNYQSDEAATEADSQSPGVSMPDDINPQTDSYMESDIDFESAFNAFPPETVMLTAGDYIVTWGELFCQLFGHINAVLYSNQGIVPNWEDLLSDGRTYAEALLDYTVEYVMMYKAMEYGAKYHGVTLSQEYIDQLQDDLQTTIESLGGEDELRKVLWEDTGCYSLELYEYLLSTSYLAVETFNTLYGENGGLLSDEETAEYTAMDGFLMAKHILRMKPEEGEDTAIGEIDSILDQLNNYNGDDFDSFFDELMYEFSEDTGGLQSYPNGYLFQYDNMTPSFSAACMALEIGTYSGVIETEYGYHIIYRLPIDYDEIPFSNYMQNDYNSLRYLVASGLFNTTLYEWIDTLAAEKTAAFDSIDIALIFA